MAGGICGTLTGARLGVDIALDSPKLLGSGRLFLRGTSACLGGALAGAAIGTAAGIIWPISLAAGYTFYKMAINTPKPGSMALKPNDSE